MPDEARVGLAAGPLRFADHAANTAPAVQRRPGEVAEAPRGLAARLALGAGIRHLGLDLADQAGVAGEAEQVIDAVDLAPGHQRLAGKAAVAAQQDAHARPTGTDAADDAFDLVGRSGGGVDVGAAQPGGKQMAAAEHVEMG